jgi:hypothetical protein
MRRAITSLFGLAVALALFAAVGNVIGTASAQPTWAAPGECVLDDGYNRYRPCNGGDGGG